jgi:glycosyltransferase involved in cell wall biosynthesis
MGSIIQGMSKLADIHIACVASEVLLETYDWVEALGATIAHISPPPLTRIKLWFKRFKAITSRCNLVHNDIEKRFFLSQFEMFDPDLVWLETPHLLRYAIDWRKQVPIIVDFWGTSEGQERDYRQAQGFNKLWQWVRWQTFKGSELKYCPLVKDIITVSELNAQHFKRIAPCSRIWPIPIGILNSPTAKKITGTTIDPNLLIFTGDMSFSPNVDAVVYFVETVLPKIQTLHPAVRLMVAGRNPSQEILAFSKLPNVQVSGPIPDLSEEIAKAAVYILPMRLGSGFRTKLLEVFPLGKPIVTTSIGAEGLELIHNENCLIADNADSFARACIALLQNADEAKNLGHKTKRLATEIYTQEKITQLVKTVISTIIGDKSAPEVNW